MTMSRADHRQIPVLLMTATLKYRTPQLSGIAAASNPLQEEAGNDVEVDLKPPHDSIYSQSLSAKIKPGELKTLGDLYALFPVTGSLREAPDTKLAVVGKTRIREQVRGKTLLDIGSSSSMSLSFWYHPNDKRRPVMAELSFRYETVKNDAENEARAQRLFEELQALDGWVSPHSMTKTAFIYAFSTGFCEQPKQAFTTPTCAGKQGCRGYLISYRVTPAHPGPGGVSRQCTQACRSRATERSPG